MWAPMAVRRCAQESEIGIFSLFSTGTDAWLSASVTCWKVCLWRRDGSVMVFVFKTACFIF